MTWLLNHQKSLVLGLPAKQHQETKQWRFSATVTKQWRFSSAQNCQMQEHSALIAIDNDNRAVANQSVADNFRMRSSATRWKSSTAQVQCAVSWDASSRQLSQHEGRGEGERDFTFFFLFQRTWSVYAFACRLVSVVLWKKMFCIYIDPPVSNLFLSCVHSPALIIHGSTIH